jgi:hypothetical protein
VWWLVNWIVADQRDHSKAGGRRAELSFVVGFICEIEAGASDDDGDPTMSSAVSPSSDPSVTSDRIQQLDLSSSCSPVTIRMKSEVSRRNG